MCVWWFNTVPINNKQLKDVFSSDHQGFFPLDQTGQVMLKILNRLLLFSEMSRRHCGNCRCAAARTRQQPLPLMPPPADLESAAPLPPFDNMINRSIREQARRHLTHQKKRKKEIAPRGASWEKRGCRLIECQKWWCENAQCHWVCFVMCLFGEGRRQGNEGVDEMIT